MTATLALVPPRTVAAAVPAAVSTSIADLIAGRRRAARVVASTTHALLVASDPPGSERPHDSGPGATDETAPDAPSLVALSGPDAVRLPCGVLLPARPPVLPVGSSASIGGGLLRVAGLSVRVGRWWRAPQPRIVDPMRAQQRATSLALPPLEEALAGPAQELAAALYSQDDLTRPVRRLLGLGCGLTPGGDDVIAGALVALHAAGAASLAWLAAAVGEAAPERHTTVISAALLNHAVRGESVPELAAFLAALDGRGDMSQAMHRLFAVGHSSGTALCHGAVLAVAGLRSALVPPLRQGSAPPRTRLPQTFR